MARLYGEENVSLLLLEMGVLFKKVFLHLMLLLK